MAEPKPPSDDERRILRFRPRNRLTGPLFRTPDPGQGQDQEPVGGLGKFEGSEADDDYRHRMIVNGVAFAFTVLLIAGGVWIVTTLADMRKNQDCYLSGQRHCTPINAPPMERF